MSDGRGGAVVTGAGRGLGLEIARALGARGYAVHVTDVDGDAAARAVGELSAEAWSSPLDVVDAAACAEVARATAARSGRLSVWVNNAGILPTGYSWEHDPDLSRRTLEINSLGTINGTVAALELMRRQGAGHVINVVSLAGLVAAPGETLYSASKHAALAFSLGTQFDLRRAGIRGIHVSALCPDGIWTPMLYDKVADTDAALSWSGILLKPEDVARAAVQLLDRPRPVRTVPQWRGLAVRFYDAFPRMALALLPLVLADARRRQREFARTIARP